MKKTIHSLYDKTVLVSILISVNFKFQFDNLFLNQARLNLEMYFHNIKCWKRAGEKYFSQGRYNWIDTVDDTTEPN